MEENKLPSFIENRIDVKGQTIFSFATVCKGIRDGELKDVISGDVNLGILTNQGLIKGEVDWLMQSDSITGSRAIGFKIIEETAFGLRNIALNENENLLGTSNIVNNHGVLTIRNATLTPFASPNTPFNLDVLYIFISDITGFTIV